MTDLLTDVEDLLSTQEVAPIPAAPAPKSATCPECGQVFSAPFENARLGAHRKAAHGVSGSSKKKKAPAERTPKAPAKAVGRPVGPTRVARKPLGESLAKIFLQVGRMINTVVDPPTGAAIMFE